jgi:hypothetical protein
MKYLLIGVLILILMGGGYWCWQASGVTNSVAKVAQPKTSIATNAASVSANKSLSATSKQPTNIRDTLIAQYKDLLAQQVTLMKKDTLTPEEQNQSDVISAKMKDLRTQLDVLNTEGVAGGIQVDAYGYKVTVKVNGQDIGIQGGMSEGERLYNAEHYSYSFADPSIKQLYSLVKGQNTISVTYTKTDPKASPMKVDVFAYTPPFDLVVMNVSGDSGSINETFDIEHDKPADVQTIAVSK